jgi:hypothetical protein
MAAMVHMFQKNRLVGKNGLLSLILLFSVPALAQQTLTEKFQKIGTVQEAQAFIDANAALKPALLKLSYDHDSTAFDKRLLRQNKGDIFSVGYVTYKVLEANETLAYRASYIYLDGSSLSQTQIDSLRNLIVRKASEGISWDKLSDEYTMDGNTTHGDTGWFFGELMMPKEFQDAVKAHKTGDIFFVDVSDRNWHYIVKKTYDDSDKKNVVVLRANGR